MRSALMAGALLLTVNPAFAVVGGGEIPIKNTGGDVIFSHQVHVSTAGQKCTACHDKFYTTVKQHKKVSMKQMQAGKSCGACHNGKAAFSVKGDCAKCHQKKGA